MHIFLVVIISFKLAPFDFIYDTNYAWLSVRKVKEKQK